jgi:quercetin dioxygenase-like cupin family protein
MKEKGPPMPTETVRVIDSAIDCPPLPLVRGPGHARAVIWPGNGAAHRSFNLIELGAGASTVDLRHPADCVYYVIAGAGRVVDLDRGAAEPLAEGNMIHIDAGDGYRLEAAAAAGMKLLGGPCPADPALYAGLAQGGAG